MASASDDSSEAAEAPPNFIHDIIDEEVRDGSRAQGDVYTRFPPEPNGYLHIGHAKSICLNFGTAIKYGGRCNLRFDDTNPTKEKQDFVDAIQRDIRWLGFEWDRLLYASDYYEQLYRWAEQLIEDGKAYVDEGTAEEISKARGDFYKPGVDSPYRDRPPAESLDLFRRMRAGEFPDGKMVLRAKIDMQSGNLNMRDPTLYRILHATHHRTGDDWCIYPMYDFAHGQSDAIEGITHSICTLEFEAHRPLYDWFLEQLALPNRPRQIEFSGLSLSYTVLSKRYLRQLVEQEHVSGWDDPRMPTLAGMRRRGYAPEAIVAFCDRLGVSKREGGMGDVSLFEFLQRERLNASAPRRMAVLRPLRVVITNYPEDESEEFDAIEHPEHPERGTRKVPFSRVLYIERDDFREDAPKKWFRLAPGREVRLRNACLIICKEVIKDDAGEVVELRCEWDPQSRGGTPADGRRVKGTLHWVSAAHAVDAEVRLYDRLFKVENPMDAPEGQDYLANLDPDSLEVLTGCKIEPSLANAVAGATVQFERLGYFCADRDGSPERPVFNRTLTLRDSWAKLERKFASG